ncbi:MAG: YfhO family protein [Saprospiraceae bacterium]|jgi:hypothetical protein|nr:YfhO family protein [Saprospiraceae bacterium]
MKINLKSILPYIIPVVIIVAASVSYFLPQFQGKVVRQGDIVSYDGAAREANEYKKKTGEEAFWTNSMFSGMPTTMISLSAKSNLIQYIQPVTSLFFNQPTGFFIVGMLGFYLLLMLLGINPWLSLLGALLFGFSTNHYILYEAGHNTKIMTIMTSPLVVSGVLLVFKRYYIAGSAVFGLGFGMNILANHPQMTYYLGLCLGILVLIEFIKSVQEKKILGFITSLAILGAIGVLAVGASASRMWTAYEYTKSTMRGGQVLKAETEVTNNQANSQGGLEWEYAMQWSNGYGDLIATFIPKIVGGGSGEWLDNKSYLAKAVGQRQPFQFPTYFGSLPFTSGPTYFGVVAVFLFILGLFVIKGPEKWWLLIVVVITMLLSLGKNFAVLNSFLFEFMPLYNKFRAPSSILSITAIFIPLLGVLAISEILKSSDKSQYLKPLYIATGILGGISLLLWAANSSFFEYSSPGDEQYAQIIEQLKTQREEMSSGSAFRSLIFILLAAGTLWLYIKEKLTSGILIAIISVLGLVDLYQIDKGYLDKKDFVNKSTYNQQFEPRPVDLQIMQDKSLSYRVLDVSINTFNSSSSSYFHKTIGGYHAAKLQRYQDIIDRHISQNNMAVLNMLNTKYFISAGQDGLAVAQQNQDAAGNAWFVDKIQLVSDANAEIDSLKNFDPSAQTFIHTEFKDYISGMVPQKNGTIQMKTYSPNKLEYESDTQSDQFAVFSEVWYGPDLGWQAYVDGKPVEHIRANYILRGMKVPAGKHNITFEFKPQSYITGEKISLVCSALILLLLGFALYKGFIKWNSKVEVV